MKQILLSLIFIAVILTGCFTIKPVDNQLYIKAEVVKIDSWVNLMPGSKETFHVSGIIRIMNNEKFDLDTLTTRMNVIQDDSVIYSVYPEMDPVVNINSPLKKGTEKELTFVLDKGLDIKKELDYDKPVKFEFIFNSKTKVRSFKTEFVNIEKAY